MQREINPIWFVYVLQTAAFSVLRFNFPHLLAQYIHVYLFLKYYMEHSTCIIFVDSGLLKDALKMSLQQNEMFRMMMAGRGKPRDGITQDDGSSPK